MRSAVLRLATGEKPCRKRMATLACVYNAALAPRRPHDVIAVPGEPSRAGEQSTLAQGTGAWARHGGETEAGR